MAWQPMDGLTSAWRLLALVTVIGMLGACYRASSDPEVPLLTDSGDGVWITADSEVDLSGSVAPTSSQPLIRWQFRRRFALDQSERAVTLKIQALRFVNVRLDDRLLLTTSDDETNWKQVLTITIPELEAGDHVLQIEVANRNGPPALWVDSERLDFVTDERWEVSKDSGHSWIGTRPAHVSQWAPLSSKFPSVPQAFQRTALWFAIIFVAAFVLTWRRSDPLRPDSRAFEAGQLRTILILACGILGLHNLGALEPYVGYDVEGHLDYIRHVTEQFRIPLASDGWQMFQSPLYYLLNAPVYWLLADRLEPEPLVRALRIMPLVCGLIQIEIACRIARLAFPDNTGMQCVTIGVGGMMPMSVSMTQSLGNEPLAGLLTALTVLRLLRLLKSDEVSHRDVAMLGVIWGLAMLAKVTPLLLAPILFLGAYFRSLQVGSTHRIALGRVLMMLGAAFAICGWYYLRNWVLMGRPFVGGWDPVRGIVWWQYPGYRMFEHFTAFGASLVQPIYSGVFGLWDGLYSTIYADGFLSGIDNYQYRPTWNESFLIAGAWWGLPPTLLILVGMFRGLFVPKRLDTRALAPVVVAAVSLVIYLSAIVYLYFRIPIYGAAKGSYLLGLLPCLGLLAAAGAEPILRSRFGSATLAGLLACWCTGTLIAFYA